MKRKNDAYDTNTRVFSVNSREFDAVFQNIVIHMVEGFGDIVVKTSRAVLCITVMYECYCGGNCVAKSNPFLWVFNHMSIHMTLINVDSC